MNNYAKNAINIKLNSKLNNLISIMKNLINQKLVFKINQIFIIYFY